MLSSEDWALMVTFRKELESLKAIYAHPTKELITVIEYLEQRVKELEKNLNDS